MFATRTDDDGLIFVNQIHKVVRVYVESRYQCKAAASLICSEDVKARYACRGVGTKVQESRSKSREAVRLGEQVST